MAAFRAAAIAGLAAARPLTLQGLQAEHALLVRRLTAGVGVEDAVALWQRLGVAQAAQVPDLNAAQVRALRPAAVDTAETAP